MHCESSFGTRSDVPFGPDDPICRLSAIFARLELEKLSAARLCQLVEGREWLRIAATRLVDVVIPEKLLHRCPARCQMLVDALGRKGCSSTLRAWWNRELAACTALKSVTVDPLLVLGSLQARMKDTSQANHGICGGCRAYVDDVLDACRKYLWDEMPYFFDIKQKDKTVASCYDRYM